MSVEETLAEKVISFLRRYAQYAAGELRQAWDHTLVRHIYDVFCIVQADPDAVVRASDNFAALVEFDVEEFGQQFPLFRSDPRIVLLSALAQAGTDPGIREDYEMRLLPLVFGCVQPGFDEVYTVFCQQAETLISRLQSR